MRFSLREPLSLSVTEDGLLFVATTYGISSFDPVAREAESLVLWGGIDELTLPARRSTRDQRARSHRARPRSRARRSPAARAWCASTSIACRASTSPRARSAGWRARSSSSPTRRNDLVERFDAAGRLVQRSKRTGETVMTASYVDARGDAIDRITDAAGGETVFSYAGGKLQSITDARGRVTQVTVNGLGDLVSVTEPGSETHTFGYAEHRMTEKRSPRGDLTHVQLPRGRHARHRDAARGRRSPRWTRRCRIRRCSTRRARSSAAARTSTRAASRTTPSSTSAARSSRTRTSRTASRASTR